MSNDKFGPKVITSAEREANKAFKNVENNFEMSDLQRKQKAFHENRERLRTLRLAREAELKAKQ